METIYKGYAFPIAITSNVELDISQCRLFNPPTKRSTTLYLLSQEKNEDGYIYHVVINGEDTAKLPIGLYDLELRTQNGYMAKYIQLFAKVVETAYVNNL